MRGRRRRGGGRRGADGGRRRDRGRAEHDSLMSKDTSRGAFMNARTQTRRTW